MSSVSPEQVLAHAHRFLSERGAESATLADEGEPDQEESEAQQPGDDRNDRERIDGKHGDKHTRLSSP